MNDRRIDQPSVVLIRSNAEALGCAHNGYRSNLAAMPIDFVAENWESEMLAGHVMSPGVTWIAPSASLREAAHVMLSKHISGLPVIEGSGKLVGMLTEGDLLRRVELGTEIKRPRWLEFVLGPGRASSEYVMTHGTRVEEVMSRDVITVSEATLLKDVVSLMKKHNVKRLPVLRDGKVVGIVSRADLLRALGSFLDRDAAKVGMRPDDVAIRSAILTELDKQNWAPTGTMNLTVSDGVVEFWGVIFDEREREALRVVAENVPGVREIRDDLRTVEPYSGTVL